MAFSDFTFPEVLADLGLTMQNVPDLFADVPPVPIGVGLRETMTFSTRLGTGAHTEFSRAVWLVGPVLSDFWRRYAGRITLIGGAEFPADREARLNGFVDFVVGLAPHQARLVAPVLVIFEAKRDSIPDGLGQCVAGMVGAQRFNRREGTPVDPIHGCVTTGSLWKFLRLAGTELTVDLTEYTLSDADKLLGILTHIVGPPPAAAAVA